jgi:hypothetical protein
MNGAAGQPSTDDGQILPGPTIALGPFLRPSAARYGQTPVPTSVKRPNSLHSHIWGREPFENPVEGEHSPLEAATKQGLWRRDFGHWCVCAWDSEL